MITRPEARPARMSCLHDHELVTRLRGVNGQVLGC
jgi:hypothetical protein